MTDLVEKARLGRTNALTRLSGAGFTPSRNATERRAVPLAFVSSRSKMGGNSVLI
jgi:hypothetical protein